MPKDNAIESIRSAGYAVWALMSVMLQVLSVIALKFAANSCGSYFCWSLIYIYVLVGGFIVLRVLFWNIALHKGSLSRVYVFTALNPMLILVLSVIFLGEQISFASAVGACMVAFAIYMQQREQGRLV